MEESVGGVADRGYHTLNTHTKINVPAEEDQNEKTLSDIDLKRIDKMKSVVRNMPAPLKPLAVKAAPKIKPKAPPKEIKVDKKSPYFAKSRDAPDTRLPPPPVIQPINPHVLVERRHGRYRDTGTAVCNLIVENMQLAARIRRLEVIVQRLTAITTNGELKSTLDDV